MAELGYLLLNALQAVFLAAWSVLWISVALVASLARPEWALVLARRCWGPGLIWASGARVQHEGPVPPLDPTRAYVFVMNHQSMFDIPVAFSFIPLNLRFFAKRSLARVPFLGWYMKRTEMVFVDRFDRQRAHESVERAIELVRRGRSLLTYPEGTRSTDGRLRPFKRGPFLIALRAGAPLVPVALHGSSELLPRGGFRLRPGRVALRIGDPIPTAGFAEADLDALVERAHQAVFELQRSIGGPSEWSGERVRGSAPAPTSPGGALQKVR